MWDSFEDSRRFILSLATLLVVFVIVMFLCIRGFALTKNNQDNKAKAYVACVQYHLPAECK